MRDGELSGVLLAWYDLNARRLPWRIHPSEDRFGTPPDPYRVWLSEIMLQQTTVPVAARYFDRFCDRWPNVDELAAAENRDVMAEWAGLGYYARARNLIKCARTISGEHGGEFPCTEAGLMKLPGVGPYTAAAIAAIAYDLPVVAVDGNVERIMARIHAVRHPLPGGKAGIAPACGQAGACRKVRRFFPGDDGSRGHGLPTPKSRLCQLSVERRLQGAETRNRRRSPRQVAPVGKAPDTRRGICRATGGRCVAHRTATGDGAAGRNAGLAGLRLGT